MFGKAKKKQEEEYRIIDHIIQTYADEGEATQKLRCFKKRLFGKAGDECVLTHLELSVCFLLSTQKYYPEAITDMLWIDKEQLRTVVQSLEAKLAAGSYRLPKGYRAMQLLVYEYCMKKDYIEEVL